MEMDTSKDWFCYRIKCEHTEEERIDSFIIAESMKSACIEFLKSELDIIGEPKSMTVEYVGQVFLAGSE